jgi:DNA (cytosine-5)-methyltransferase 1
VTSTAKRSGYGVKLVRGPFVKLAPHSLHVTDAEGLGRVCAQLRASDGSTLLAADLFSGAGGLSLGLEAANVKVVLSVDHDAEAVETHRHHFPGLSEDWDLSSSDAVERVAELMRDNAIEVLAGGPPCQPFSKAGRSGIRHRVRHGLRDPHDERRDLWRSFVEVAKLARPRAVIMENVPDMALDKEMFIFRAVVEELEAAGYSVRQRVVETWRYGVPQFRQRLILVALRDGLAFAWPTESPNRVTVWNAIGDLPEVDGGWRPAGGAEGWLEYDDATTWFQSRMREGLPREWRTRIYDHITRPVREDDARAFEQLDPGTRYSELSDDVKRYRDDIFDDKYKRLDEDDLSRTITAHIAKDGYWYIHPRQNRTITVREAARLQTFPDRYRFAGPPSAAFRQIGNAVPPFLGEHLGGAVRESLDAFQPQGLSSRETADRLASWFHSLSELAVPWLRATSRWQVISADLLLDRMTPADVRSLWPLLERWTTPNDTLAAADELEELASWVRRQDRAAKLLALAVQCVSQPALTSFPEGVPQSSADFATLVVPVEGEDAADEPVLATRGILRVASRVNGDLVDRKNRLTDGRLSVARLIGSGSTARDAHKALVEIAASVCRPDEPECGRCPLSQICVTAPSVAKAHS